MIAPTRAELIAFVRHRAAVFPEAAREYNALLVELEGRGTGTADVGLRAVAYMAECMGMRHTEDDQEQNFILGHLHTFALNELEQQSALASAPASVAPTTTSLEMGFYGPVDAPVPLPDAAPSPRRTHYDCGCRIQGGVGVPGCSECTEPGLRS